MFVCSKLFKYRRGNEEAEIDRLIKAEKEEVKIVSGCEPVTAKSVTPGLHVTTTQHPRLRLTISAAEQRVLSTRKTEHMSERLINEV